MAPLSARCLDELGQAGLLVLLSLVMLGSLHGSAVCAAPTIVCDGETTPARALDVDCGGTQTGAEFVVRDCQLAQINVEYQIEFCTVTIHNTVLHDGGISVATATSVPNPAGLRLNMTNITVEAVPEGRPIPIRSDKGGWPYGHIFDGCTGCSITLDGFRSSNASLIETYNLDQALSNSVGSTLVVRNVGTEAVPASHLAYEACTNAVRASIEVSHVVAAGAAFAYLGRSSVDSVLAVSDVFGALSRRGQKGQHDNAFFGMLANSNGAAMVARHIVHRAEHENFFKYLCENCTHGRVLIEHVSSPDAWNAAPTENHVYRYMGRGSSHFSFAIRHVTNIRDAFNNICQSASHCTGEVSDVSDMFLSFGLAAAKLGPEPRAVNVTIDYSDIRRVNGAMSLGGYMSLDSAFRYRNIRHAINFTMSMACMLGENCRMEASGIEDSDEILAVLGQSSKNSRCVLRDLHNVSRIFAKPTKQMKFAGLGSVCEPGSKNSGACEQFIDAVFDVIPSSGSEIYLRNATLNPSGDQGFSYLARNGVGAAIDMDDVRFVPSARSAPLIMFEDAWKGSGVLKPCENWLYSVTRLLMDEVFGSQCDFVGASVMRFGPDFDWSTMPFKTAFAAAGELSVNATLDLSRSADYGCDLFDGTTRMSITAFTSNAQTPKVILNASLCTDPLNILSLFGFGFFMAPVARAHFSLIDVAPRPASSPIKRFAIANVGHFELTTDKFRTGQVSVLELSITDTDMTDLDAIIEAFGPAVGRQLRFVDARRNRLTGPAIRRVVMSVGQNVNVAANGASGASIAISDLAAIAGSPATTTSGAPREVVIGEFSMAAVVQGKLNVGIGIEAECLTTSANVIVRYWTVKQNGSYPLSVASAGPFNASEALCRGCVPGEPIDLAQPCRSATPSSTATASVTESASTTTTPSVAPTATPTIRIASHTKSPSKTQRPAWVKESPTLTSIPGLAPCPSILGSNLTMTPASITSDALAQNGALLRLRLGDAEHEWARGATLKNALWLRATASTAQSGGFNAHRDEMLSGPDAGVRVDPADPQVVLIRLAPAPTLSVVGDVGERVEVIVGGGAFACSNGGARLLFLDLTPFTPPSLAAAQTSAAVNGAAGAVAGIASGAAAADAQALVVLGLVECGSSAAKSVPKHVQYLLGPVPLGEGSEGIVAGNLVLLVVFATLQGIVILVLKAMQKMGKRAGSWNQNLSTARMPGLTLVVAMLLQQGTAAHSSRLLLKGEASAVALMGFALSAAVPLVIIHIGLRFAKATFSPIASAVSGEDLRLVFFKYCYLLDGVPRDSFKATALRQLYPVGRWGPALPARSLASPYKGVRPVWIVFAAAPVLQGFLIGVIAALPVNPDSVTVCGMQYGAMGVVAFAMACGAIAARPYRSDAMAWLQLVSSVTLVLVIIANIGMLTVKSEAPGGWAAFAGAASAVQTVVLLVRTVYAATIKGMEVVCWSEDARSFVWVESMTSFEPEKGDDDLEELLTFNASGEPEQLSALAGETLPSAEAKGAASKGKKGLAAAGKSGGSVFQTIMGAQ